MGLFDFVKDIFGGGGGGETVVTNTDLPEYAKPYFLKMMGRAEALSEQPYQPYTGDRLAGFAPDTLKGYQGLRGLAGQGTWGTNQAMNMAQGAMNFNPAQYNPSKFNYQRVNPGQITGGHDYRQMLDRFENPYINDVLEVQKQGAIQDYQRLASDRNANYIKAGAFGGSRQAVADYLGEEGLANRMAGIEAQGRNAAFQQAQQAALNAQQFNIGNRLQAQQLNQAANLQTQQMRDASKQFGADLRFRNNQLMGDLGIRSAALMGDLDKQRIGLGADLNRAMIGVGQDYQNQAQQALNLKYDEFVNARDYPRLNLQYLAGILRGVPGNVNSSVTSSNYVNPVSSLIGSGISGYAMSKLIGGQGQGNAQV